MVGIGLGVLAGFVLHRYPEGIGFVEPIGDMFIRLLKMIIIPLIMATMVMGVLSVGDARKLGRIGLKTFLYYLVTTLLAVVVGLVLVNIIRPGVGLELGVGQVPDLPDQSITSIFTDIVPVNIFGAMAEGKVLPVIFFSLLLGSVLTVVRESAAGVVAFFEGFNAVMMKLTEWIMRLAPFGVFALIAVLVGRTGIEAFGPLAKYIFTVLAGLGFHALITLPLLLWLVGGYSPLRLFRHVSAALATAFSTASSAATLPITMECLEKKAGVSNQTASFVLPLGATVNMDGTALYEAVAALFIAQVYNIELDFVHQVIIVLTATLASIGAAAIPSAGLFTMAIVLKAVGLPLEGIGLILAVDRVLDMCRTAVNVWGDSCGTAVIARLEGEELS